MRDKLKIWADLLLDTGKKNNLINFRDTKGGTVKIVAPDFASLFSRAQHGTVFEVYDPKIFPDEDLEDMPRLRKFTSVDLSEEEFSSLYAKKLKKASQILVYNRYTNPLIALKNVGKKAKSALEETGVNIAFMAFGFVDWFDKGEREYSSAPVLLAPISIDHPSAIDPYYVKMVGDEILLNPTFSFKLQTEYGIKLPDYDDEGIDEYLEKILLIVGKLGWAISKECKISIFSFLKINMHQDVKQNADLILKNEQVKALLGEVSATDEEITLPPISELKNVVDADSSQAEAILLAKTGKSFVLQGPPGTGKSQTITNIIAECLADGKKVLFVSEKLAALNVVYDKLRSVGLDEFCLELHSHKANKKDFISELCETLNSPKINLSGKARFEIKERLRAEGLLDEYKDKLHEKRENIDKTLYEIIEEYYGVSHFPDLNFVFSDLESKGDDYLYDSEGLLSRFQNYTESIGYDYRLNPWYGYEPAKGHFAPTAKMGELLERLGEFLTELDRINQELSVNYGISVSSISSLDDRISLFSFISECEYVNPILLENEVAPIIRKKLPELEDLACKILAQKQIIDGQFKKEAYSLSGQLLYSQLLSECDGFFKRLFKKEYRRIISKLRLASVDGKPLNYERAVYYTKSLADHEQLQAEFEQKESLIKKLLSDSYEGIYTHFSRLAEELERLEKMLSKKQTLGTLAKLSSGDFYTKQPEFKKALERLNSLRSRYEKPINELIGLFNAKQVNILAMSIQSLSAWREKCANGLDRLESWIEFKYLLDELDNKGLTDYIIYSIKNNLSVSDLVGSFKKALLRQWAEKIYHSSEVLVRLSRIPHDQTVDVFAQKDEVVKGIHKATIRSTLSQLRPSLDLVAQGSAVSVLLREGEKKRKQKSIRSLLEEIEELIFTLKPCFLMSPLSVSTFLSPQIKFDVVIFDEASQIFPQDAIGAIYRANQLIVVGDSKQMPPSNFFTSNTLMGDDEDEIDEVTDFESILDLCSTAFPHKRLKWHYRSRYEQLIAFSNANFYDGELVTFPSARADRAGIGVDRYFVNGVFDRRTKTNLAEAQRVVELIYENVESFPERSLGVVALSISQQELIDKLLLKRRKEDPSKEWFFKSDREEPFFIKNLETVQGDERDTIIFSIAYAKDESGKLLLNFGPINKQGGERRLNVATTRAKHNLQLVTSMLSSDIDLARSESRGTMLLKGYLEYAETGVAPLSQSALRRNSEVTERHFEKEIKEFLQANGFEAEELVGSSAYKIDLAVKHPKTKNFVLAIECDGNNYRSLSWACDRDRLRAQVLGRMGWSFYRIWSCDWLRNTAVEKERLLSAVRTAIDRGTLPSGLEPLGDEISFEENIEGVGFEFPVYNRVNLYLMASGCGFDLAKIIKMTVKEEAPLSEEWLLKRIPFLLGREKVTPVVKEEFERCLSKLSSEGIVRRNGFIYLDGEQIPMLRIPKEGEDEKREIAYISDEELALGIKEVLKENVTVDKNGLFRFLVHKLGFSRIGEAITAKFEGALSLLSGEITVNGDMISLS